MVDLYSDLRSTKNVEKRDDMGCFACKSEMELVVTKVSPLLKDTDLELLREHCTTEEDEEFVQEFCR